MSTPAKRDLAALDVELRQAVHNVMESPRVEDDDLAKVQELVDRRAALMRAPFTEKIRRIKEVA